MSTKNGKQRRRCQDFYSLDHAPHEDFIKSQWQKQSKSIIYLIYRWLIALFFIAVVVESMFIDPEDWTAFGLFFVYLTNWALVACMVSTVLGAILVTVWYFHDVIVNDHNLIRIYWAAYNISLSVSIVVSILYWTFIFNESEKPISTVNICTHILNSIFMIMDLLIVAHPMRFLHMFLPVSLGLTYVLFSFIYQKLGGVNKKGEPYIYHVTDWNEPISASFAVIGISILTCCIHMTLYLVYKARMCVSQCINGPNDSVSKNAKVICDEDDPKGNLKNFFTVDRDTA